MPDLAVGAFTFAALLAAGGLLLVVLGLPFRWLFAPSRPDPFLIETAAIGGAVFGAVSWNWARFGSGGMHRAMPILLGLDAVALVVIGLRGGRFRAGLGNLRLPSVARAVAAPALLLVATVALFALHYPGIYDGAAVEPVSAGNNDLPLYGLNSEHMAHAGFDDRAHIGTYRLGKYAQKDVSGAFLFVAAVHAVTGAAEWRVCMPVLALGVLLLMAALAHLVGRLGVCSLLARGSIAALAVSSATFFYNMIHGFLAYSITLGAMVLVLALAIELGEAASARERRWLVAVGAGALTWVYAVYPHVAFFFVPLLAVAVVVHRMGSSESVRQWVTTSVAGLVGVAAMFVLPVLLIPDRVYMSVKRTLHLGGGIAGWSLGRVGLGQWLGVKKFAEPTGRDVTVFGDGLRVAAVLGAVALLAGAAIVVALAFVRTMRAGEPRARWLALLGLLSFPLAFYEVLHLRYGELYQAWKAMTYMQPVFLAVLLALAWHVLQLAAGPRAGWARLAGACAAALLLLVTIGVGRPQDNRFVFTVTPGHRALETITDRYGMKTLNLDLDSPSLVWDSLWAMYFIQDAVLYEIGHPYAPPSLRPRSAWTLRSPEDPPPPGVTRHPLEGRFVLDFDPAYRER